MSDTEEMENVKTFPRTRGMAWLGELTRGDKGPHATVSNTIIVLCNDDKLAGLLAYDDFAHAVVTTREPPRAFSGAAQIPGPYPRAATDSDLTMIQGYVQRTYDMRISQPVAQQAAAAAAEMRRMHPVREWLAGLRWDGEHRLETWLSVAFGTPADEYHKAVGTKMLCAAVRRVRRPGVKFDHVPVFEGDQGKGKSRACEALFSTPWFKDDLSHDLGDKDAQQGMAGRWGVELAELQVLVRSTSQAAKSFFSRRVDHFRPSYGRSFVERPRQCIFIGTTNETDYLTDATGNRRYWPIRCTKVDVEWIEENREQLWAEAAALEMGGISIWLDDDTIRVSAEAAQETRMAEDVWGLAVQNYASTRQEIAIPGVLHDGLGLPRDKQNRGAEMRVAGILKGLGWMPYDFREGSKKVRRWFPPGALLPGSRPERRVPSLPEPPG